jgi:hypothetical protein
MNNCPECQHELVNILYGYPSPAMIDMAKTEGIALGGCCVYPDSPKLYCYGCHETFVSNLQEI